MTHTFDIVRVLVEKELKSKYKNTSIGFLWSIIQPLMMATVFYFAFQEIMRVQIKNYAFFMISGLFVWQWITISINNSMFTYITNRSIVKKIAIDRKLLPLSVVLTEMFHFILSISVILVFMYIYKIPFTSNWFYLPLMLLLQILWIYGLTMIVSIANTFFRDIERIVGTLLQILFYASPIIYSVDIVPEEYKFWINLNPVTPMIELWHSIFIGSPIKMDYLQSFAISSIVILVIGLIVNQKFVDKIAETL
jgi:lipopolysaccharide transport system permease protein